MGRAGNEAGLEDVVPVGGAHPVRNAWEFRRAKECCVAHAAADFKEQVQTERREVADVIEEIFLRVSGKDESARGY